MKHIQDELQKSLKYHLRQLEENLQKMKTYEEATADLKMRNESHKEAITEIKHYLEKLEAQQDCHPIEPIEKQSKHIITGVDVS